VVAGTVVEGGDGCGETPAAAGVPGCVSGGGAIVALPNGHADTLRVSAFTRLA
jgi:hypothetical protein